jgi:hypothetical protein
MHTKCPECNLEFTPEELHDASLEDHLEYKRITNDLIKELRLKLEHDQVMEWCKAKLNDYVIGLEAENARYRKALEFYADKTNYSYACYEYNLKTCGDDELGSHAREALREI